MNIKTVKDELWQIAKAYPTLAGLLQKTMPNGQTIGHHWAELLKDLDPEHFENVCYDYSTLKEPLPHPIDQLAFTIRQEVRERMNKDQARWEQHQKYHNQKKWKQRSKDPYYRMVHWIIQNGPLPEDKLEELVGWCVWDKPKPDWVDAT